MLDDADEFITPSFVGLIESIHVCHNHLKSLKYRNNWAQSYEILFFFRIIANKFAYNYSDMKQKEKPIVAMIYDFDGTLAPGNMQEYDFLKQGGLAILGLICSFLN